MNRPKYDLSIVCPAPKRGIKERPAHGTLIEEDGKFTTFRLDETKRDFNQYRFPIQPGYLIFSPVAVYVRRDSSKDWRHNSLRSGLDLHQPSS